MSSVTRRGGIPGPESRTGLTRPSMTEAEFERRIGGQGASADPEPADVAPSVDPEPAGRASSATSRTRVTRAKAAKPKRVQRMFAIEEDVDKKLWLYAIHMGKDRSEVVNDLLRPIVASMVLYDSRDRRGGRSAELTVDRGNEAEGDAA
ncbi:hypothetical protein [Paludisphaera borealis]|uniref:Uncharacterized protein n=1 Tax=Paludisphaera borealis TaxID=1387353 RepID=A0A1U7CZ57_9BACT|nr:hypothetical protein [Paludisphaera borealis]APW64224.1 hypothetical protein BSF38_10005 [Paludisphaera borealis]